MSYKKLLLNLIHFKTKYLIYFLQCEALRQESANSLYLDEMSLKYLSYLALIIVDEMKGKNFKNYV